MEGSVGRTSFSPVSILSLGTLADGRDAGASVVPLPGELRARAERFFGTDFTSVRVHLGRQATRLGCDALACGTDLYFAPEGYAPAMAAGARAVMHELAHVVQQREGRAINTAERGVALVNDPALEAEADAWAEAALAGVTHRRSGRAAPRQTGAPVAQPIVTVGHWRYTKNGGQGKNFDAIWDVIGPYFERVPKSQREQVKTKLKHWVNAERRGGLFGKGHDKTFNNDVELMRALVGQVDSTASKAYERQLASRVQSSGFIKRQIGEYIRGPLARIQKALKDSKDPAQQELYQETTAGGKDAGRYAYYYSKAISGVARGFQRSLAEAMDKFCKSYGSVSDMSAFIADYSMVARDLLSEEDHPYILPQEDSRMNNGGFNVNESSEWVRRARVARVRLGAGASATTMNVLRVARAQMGQGKDADTTMLCLCLGLFAFWNLEMDKLKSFAEIHTFHEVMVVGYGYGLPAVPSLTGGSDAAAEFDYPQLTEIPG
jgi:hypothetical protein